MEKKSSIIENVEQDRNSIAWRKLCEYVEHVSKESLEEFSPLEILGYELYSQIYTLPESIATLKNVKKLWLYGSNLKQIPPEIGQMEALEYFDPYTSYNLHWFPYEIMHCKNLKESRISTRVLYGNYKNRLPFPSLEENQIRYHGNSLNCSVCKKQIDYTDTNQMWITIKIATDIVPLLVNLCSVECKNKLPQPPEDYVQFPHKGGPDLEQPKLNEREYLMKYARIITIEEVENWKRNNKEPTSSLKLKRKLWDNEKN